MKRYVEWDGDWVVQPPGIMTNVAIDLMVLRAKYEILRDEICRALLDRPSAGAVTARPLLPAAFVFRVQIGKGASVEHPEQGWQAEDDLGFLVPVVVTTGHLPEFAALVPYIFVDNWVGMITGREVFGFPKQMATFGAVSGDLSVDAIVAPDNPGDQAIPKRIIALEGLHSARRKPLNGDLVEGIIRRIFDHLGCPEELESEEVLPLRDSTKLSAKYVFLKQFRDAHDTAAACYQAIVRAPVEVRVREAHIITSPVTVRLPPRTRLEIARKLGLTTSNPGSFVAELGFSMRVEMAISPGSILWSACPEAAA
jgi:hypothetical protein